MSFDTAIADQESDQTRIAQKVDTVIADLESGQTRIAQKVGQEWVVNTQIKRSILELFRQSEVIKMPGGFCDKSPLTTQQFDTHSRVRMVPGGSAVRAGAHIGNNVVIMPPSYVNIGAFVDEDTMVDSHVLVGSCAQIGKRVHLSAGVQIGGVLEPIGQRPVIIEDDCFIGAGAILTEGILVRQGAVIAASVTLTAAVPIYDLVHQNQTKGEIPENAVVVAGTRPVRSNAWGHDQGMHLNCAIIIKYRDEKTDAATLIEDALR